MKMFSNETAWHRADLLGYDADGTLQLVIELKPRMQSGAMATAGQWFQDIGQQRPELYALFITPEYILLRMPAGRRLSEPRLLLMRAMLKAQLFERIRGEMDYAVGADASLDMAIDTQRVPLQKLDPLGLQRVVESWLDSCLATPAAKLTELPAQGWLVNSGLHQALQKGQILPPVGGPSTYAFAG